MPVFNVCVHRAKCDTVSDVDYPTRGSALRAFHKAAAKHIADSEMYVSCGLLVASGDGWRRFRPLATKSRLATWVELSQAYYEGGV